MGRPSRSARSPRCPPAAHLPLQRAGLIYFVNTRSVDHSLASLYQAALMMPMHSAVRLVRDRLARAHDVGGVRHAQAAPVEHRDAARRRGRTQRGRGGQRAIPPRARAERGHNRLLDASDVLRPKSPSASTRHGPSSRSPTFSKGHSAGIGSLEGRTSVLDGSAAAKGWGGPGAPRIRRAVPTASRRQSSHARRGRGAARVRDRRPDPFGTPRRDLGSSSKSAVTADGRRGGGGGGDARRPSVLATALGGAMDGGFGDGGGGGGSEGSVLGGTVLKELNPTAAALTRPAAEMARRHGCQGSCRSGRHRSHRRGFDRVRGGPRPSGRGGLPRAGRRAA